ncbi:hypothetical protein J1605_013757 [Eschrichtius robustus]|uniref:Uncharacterized protein n=1 Tax=Eschrichtius robustus TaxID=9764 RepID=A0AB34GG38_ESCRO|nr:hypothetical protein J1605_013757 [Eschrichtius robustus]
MRCSSPGKLGGSGGTTPPNADAGGARPVVPGGEAWGADRRQARPGRGLGAHPWETGAQPPVGHTEEDTGYHPLEVCWGPVIAFCGTSTGLPSSPPPFVVFAPLPRWDSGGAVRDEKRALEMEPAEPG